MKYPVLPAMLWVLVMLTASCHRDGQSGDLDAVASLTRGMSLREVESTLGREHGVQFHALKRSDEYLCISYAFCRPDILLYLVFKNGKLDRITEPAPFAIRQVAYDGEAPEGTGTMVPRRVPQDPWQRMAGVLSAADISGQAALESVVRRCPRGETAIAIVPATIIAAPLLPFMLAGGAHEFHTSRASMARCDPLRVDMAASSHDVLDLFGVPLRSGEVNGLLVDTFCVDHHLDPATATDVAPSFNVVYDNFAKVRYVFAGDFAIPAGR